VNFGIEIKNSQGQILIDGEHPLPKLHAQGRIRTSYEDVRWNYGYLSFNPTSNPVFVTVAIDEEATTSGAIIEIIVERNSSNQFYRTRIETTADIYTFVWVYVL